MRSIDTYLKKIDRKIDFRILANVYFRILELNNFPNRNFCSVLLKSSKFIIIFLRGCGTYSQICLFKSIDTFLHKCHHTYNKLYIH